ncbi:MAG: EamA family transporter [Acidobacteria bacterium]|nr:EamA family transporter [Acidobacteriota bacterium]
MSIIFLLVGLSSGFAHSIYSALSKALLKNRIKEPFLLFLYISVIQALVTPLLWIFIRPQFPPSAGWTPLLLSCITCVAAYLFLYSALHCGDVSSVMPIMGSKVIFAGLLAIPMLHEKHSWQIYMAVVLVATAIAILSYSPSKSGSSKFPLKPIALMTSCCVIFGFTDIFIKRSLVYLDSYNFMIYYNFTVGILSLCVIPYIKGKRASIVLKGMDLRLSVYSAVSLVTATLLFTVMLEMSSGVVIPNILQSTRGIFIVLISAVLTHRGSTMLETQSRKVYMLRLTASILIIISIWIASAYGVGPG